jgi:hypothetical protein
MDRESMKFVSYHQWLTVTTGIVYPNDTSAGIGTASLSTYNAEDATGKCLTLPAVPVLAHVCGPSSMRVVYIQVLSY